MGLFAKLSGAADTSINISNLIPGHRKDNGLRGFLTRAVPLGAAAFLFGVSSLSWFSDSGPKEAWLERLVSGPEECRPVPPVRS
jgi:hypothetical protein